MKCLIDGCDGVGKIRGLCPTCYQAAAAIIKKGLATWEELESSELANKPQHKSSGHGAFAKAFRKQLGQLSGDVFDKDKEEELKEANINGDFLNAKGKGL